MSNTNFHDHPDLHDQDDLHDQSQNGSGYDAGYADDLGPALPGLEYDLTRRRPGAPGLVAEPPQPVNWDLLSADDAQAEWLELDRWVSWLRHTYGLPSSVIPPLWHRHPELVWELSALHLNWLCAYDPQALGTAPLGWHREFAETRLRLRDWVTSCGTRTDSDRPTPQASWPGEPVDNPGRAVEITNRDDDFAHFVTADIARRRKTENEFYAQVAELADRDLHTRLRDGMHEGMHDGHQS